MSNERLCGCLLLLGISEKGRKGGEIYFERLLSRRSRQGANRRCGDKVFDGKCESAFTRPASLSRNGSLSTDTHIPAVTGRSRAWTPDRERSLFLRFLAFFLARWRLSDVYPDHILCFVLAVDDIVLR